ncbi:histidine phosphatase family protein [Candidatus Thorarchaeota archaeon]|nr:MAG: histidine phosphatase family protein [Candidatus Thorarchaeota archaeon]
MSNSIYFLRHAETKIDLSIPVREWSLTADGINLTQMLSRESVFENIKGIVHSSERKAQQTAEIFAKELSIPTYEIPELDELRRNHQGKLSQDEYRSCVRETLTKWDTNTSLWESANDALNRFKEGVRRINIMYHNNDVLAVSHGMVLILYFSSLRNLENIAYERWSQLAFLSWGLVRDGKVLIDII